jgi:fructosamine-3-kinase
MDAALGKMLDALGEGTHRVELDGRSAVVKRRRRAPSGFFAIEAHGLRLLHEAGALRVPAVYAVRDDALVIEDLGSGRASAAAWERAGRGLARLHSRGAAQFGLAIDGWCGLSPQPNAPTPDGYRFFAECRLLFQGRRAFDAGRLDKTDLDALERLCADLPSRVPPQPPALLHGDLWTGNLHACADGELALIDAAAVHYGWAEADLAMLTLFGEPPERFFAAYREASDVDPRWRSRAPVYNLYHLLNHLNLFGAGYLGAVRAALERA